MNALALLALMVSLVAPGIAPLSVVDGRRETFDEGARRYLTIARELADATSNATEQRFVLSVFVNESTFRRDVHAGTNHNGKRTKMEDRGASWCLGQIHLGQTSAHGRKLVGVSAKATRRCINETLARLKFAIRRCKKRPICVFAFYGGVKDPKGHKGIAARVRSYAKTAKRAPLTERTREAIK